MSRVGKEPIAILPDVKVELKDALLKVQGPLGALEQMIDPGVILDIKDDIITVTRRSDEKLDRSLHGLYRTLVANMVEGVKNGFNKRLIVEGIGYRSEIIGRSVVLEVGFSHPVVFRMPDGIDVKLDGNNTLVVSGVSKQLVGEVAATIRKIRPPEPYKGKGIRYDGEHIRRKAGKTASSS